MKKQTQWGVQWADNTIERVEAKDAFYRKKGDPYTAKAAAKDNIKHMRKYGEELILVKRSVFTIKGKNGETVKIKTKWVRV